MLEWHEFIDELLRDEHSFDGIDLSFDDGVESTDVPPIIKASILMLDKMIERQGPYNIIVFPERVQSIFIFTLMKLLHNIAEGKISRNYDLSAFSAGDRLKLGNVVVEFMGVEEVNGVKHLKIKLADLIDSAPIEFFPLFQKTSTQRRLSRYSQFVLAKKRIMGHTTDASPDERLLDTLADYKTHMDSSIFNVTSLISTKEAISHCKLCGKRINDILLIGQSDYEGSIRNIAPGQLAGIPSIVLASDMYAVAAAAERGQPVQSIIIDASDSNRIQTQMDVLDDLMRLRVPIICVTDIVNSFELQPFITRSFNVWRWDETSITRQLYDATSLPSDTKIKHCATRKIECLRVDGNEISDSIRRLSARRNESKEQSAQMMKVYGDLSTLSFNALRETVPLADTDIDRARSLLNDCLKTLAAEKKYLAPDSFMDYNKTITNLTTVYSSGYSQRKHDALAERLRTEKYREICMVVPERSDKKRIQDYWNRWCSKRGMQTTVHVLYPAEYYPISCTTYSATVVVGWLKRAIMRKVLYSFNTQQYIVLLYDYERRWMNYDTSRWNTAINCTKNESVVKKSFSNESSNISTTRFEAAITQSPEEPPINDELNEIDLVLRENKFRQYVARGGSKPENETVEAIPVNYVGGYLAFYRTGHKIVSATKIISEDAEKIETVLPAQLNTGDFIVVRETDRDIIKEIADIILANSGKSGLREMATKWKDAIEIELLFSRPEEVYEKLLAVGCTKGYQAVRSWLMDEDVIAPQQKQDLKYIAEITENSVINELLDQIFDAAQEVRAAHVQAGRALSIQLRSRVVEALASYGDIDPFNIWEPIELSVDGIGIVRILKIIDIGAPVVVDVTDTNRLIEE